MPGERITCHIPKQAQQPCQCEANGMAVRSNHAAVGGGLDLKPESCNQKCPKAFLFGDIKCSVVLTKSR